MPEATVIPLLDAAVQRLLGVDVGLPKLTLLESAVAPIEPEKSVLELLAGSVPVVVLGFQVTALGIVPIVNVTLFVADAYKEVAAAVAWIVHDPVDPVEL